MRGQQVTRTGEEPEGYVFIATMSLAEYLYHISHTWPQDTAIHEIEQTVRLNLEQVRGTPRLED